MRELLTTRERLKRCSTRELWHMHEKIFVEHEEGGGPFLGTPRFQALRAALEASAHEASTLALATLRDASCFWECDDRPAPEEEAAFSCLMDMPHPDALPLLVRATFGREQRLSDFAEPALVRCGEEAFDHVRSAYLPRDNGYSIYTVGEFHVPEVEEVLTELFRRESKADERTEIGIALCMIFPTHALPHILDVVLRGAWSPRVEPLDERLVVAARAAEWDPPELRADPRAGRRPEARVSAAREGRGREGVGWKLKQLAPGLPCGDPMTGESGVALSRLS